MPFGGALGGLSLSRAAGGDWAELDIAAVPPGCSLEVQRPSPRLEVGPGPVLSAVGLGGCLELNWAPTLPSQYTA